MAVIIAAQPGLDGECIKAAAGQDGLDIVKQLKQTHELNFKVLTEDMVGPDKYPPTMAEFRTACSELYNKAYADGEPVQNPLDVLSVARLKSIVPCRESSSAVRNSNRGASHSQAIVQQLTAMLQEREQRAPVRPPGGLLQAMLPDQEAGLLAALPRQGSGSQLALLAPGTPGRSLPPP